MEQSTLADPGVKATIQRSFVPLVVDGNSDSPLVKELSVKAYPATFIISTDAVVLDRLDGYLNSAALAKRLAAVQSTAQAATWRAVDSTSRE